MKLFWHRLKRCWFSDPCDLNESITHVNIQQFFYSALFWANIKLILILLAIWDSSKKQAKNGWQIDGYGSINEVFSTHLTLPVSFHSCLSVCFSLFHLLCVSSDCKPLLFKYNLKMLHCCLLWPSVNNVLLLSSDWTKVKARLEWVG